MSKVEKKGSLGFSKEYWDVNYESPEEMDGIGNVDLHVNYIKNLFGIEYIDINSVIDLGFGLGHLFEAVLKEYIPYKAYGIEPSEHAFNVVSKRNISPAESTKFKLEKTDLVTWCQANKQMKNFDLGLCTSVFQYLTDAEIKTCMPVLAQRCKYLYFSVPTDIELQRQVEELEFDDKYAIKRTASEYKKLISPHFTFVSSRVLESKIHFNEQNSFFTDLLFRF